MEILRQAIALIIFCTGISLTLSLFGHFDWLVLGLGILSFFLAYFIWPSKARGQREQGHPILNILEFFIELPVELLLWMIRIIMQSFRHKDTGVDIDF